MNAVVLVQFGGNCQQVGSVQLQGKWWLSLAKIPCWLSVWLQGKWWVSLAKIPCWQCNCRVSGECLWQKSLVGCQCNCRVSGGCLWQKSLVGCQCRCRVSGGCLWQKSLVGCQCNCRASGGCLWQKSLVGCQWPCLKLVLSWRENNCECDLYRNCKRTRAAIFLFLFEKHSYQKLVGWLVGWSETQVDQQSAGGGGDLHLAHSPPGLWPLHSARGYHRASAGHLCLSPEGGKEAESQTWGWWRYVGKCILCMWVAEICVVMSDQVMLHCVMAWSTDYWDAVSGGCCWSLLYSTILCSQPDSLHSCRMQFWMSDCSFLWCVFNM